MSHHLVGLGEIAAMLGVSRQRVGQLAEGYPDFPKPEAELLAGRVWSRAAVETWMAMHPERPSGRTAGRGTMFERFTDRARRSIVQSLEEARNLNHNYVGCEHLVIGLVSIGEGVAWQALDGFGVSPEDVRGTVKRVVGSGPSRPEGHVAFTPRAAKALELARQTAVDLGHKYVGTEHVLLGILWEGENVGCQVLTELGLDLGRVRLKVREIMGFPQPTLSADDGTPGTEPLNEPLKCSFCDRSKKDVERIVAGPGAYICNHCIALCNEIIEEGSHVPVGRDHVEARISDPVLDHLQRIDARLKAIEERLQAAPG